MREDPLFHQVAVSPGSKIQAWQVKGKNIGKKHPGRILHGYPKLSCSKGGYLYAGGGNDVVNGAISTFILKALAHVGHVKIGYKPSDFQAHGFCPKSMVFSCPNSTIARWSGEVCISKGPWFKEKEWTIHPWSLIWNLRKMISKKTLLLKGIRPPFLGSKLCSFSFPWPWNTAKIRCLNFPTQNEPKEFRYIKMIRKPAWVHNSWTKIHEKCWPHGKILPKPSFTS